MINNKKLPYLFVLIILLFSCNLIFAQSIAPSILKNPWKAFWITGPGASDNPWATMSDPSLKDYGVYKFRKNINLASKPSSFIVHISGDNRYKLLCKRKIGFAGTGAWRPLFLEF